MRGDGIFEAIRIHDGFLFALDRHLKRLERSAQKMLFNNIDLDSIKKDLQKVALNTNKKILKEVQLFDVYEGKSLDKGKKSYGLSFTFQDKNKTLTDKQVDKVMKELQKNFEQEFDSKLR